MAKPKVAFMTGIPDDMLKEIIPEFPSDLDVTVVRRGQPEEDQIAACKDARYMVGALGGPTPDVLKTCDSLKFFQLWSAGFEFLPLDILKEKGVVVSNNGGSNSIAVAEVAIALMMCVYRNLRDQWLSIDKRQWRQGLNPTENFELTGKTVGVIGLGHIGKDVAQRLNGWAGRILYYDVMDVPKSEEERLGAERVSLETLLKESDLVTLHVPYNKHTHHLMGEQQFGLMKPTGVFVNTCRGGTMDEKALVKALKEGQIAAAGLDVFETEPIEPDNPLLDMDNAFCLPHRAGASVDTFRRSANFGFENIRRVERGEAPLARVFPPR